METQERKPNFLMQFFVWEHLKSEELKEVSRPFGELATTLEAMTPEERKGDGWEGGFLLIRKTKERVLEMLPNNPERDWCAIKLSEAEDEATEKYSIDVLLRSVLEAKDCAVRARLAK